MELFELFKTRGKSVGERWKKKGGWARLFKLSMRVEAIE